jgi:hypothetical protein
LTTLPAATATPSPTAAPLTEQVVIRTYNTVGVAARDLAVARRVVADILNDVGIEVVWRACHGAGPSDEAPATLEDREASTERCDDVLGPQELIVRIARGTARIDRAWLGYSFVDTKQKRGSLATVFADRVEQLAAEAGFDRGMLLGRTIAHELGHLLMGTSTHPRRGLMRGHWHGRDGRLQLASDWLLSRAEGAKMRRGLVARSRLPPQPATVVAEIVDPEER